MITNIKITIKDSDGGEVITEFIRPEKIKEVLKEKFIADLADELNKPF